MKFTHNRPTRTCANPPVVGGREPLRLLWAQSVNRLMVLLWSLAAAGIFTAEAAGAASSAAPATPTSTSKQTRPKVEVCFVLDTTGSMTGLIEGAKQKIWSIANDLIKATPTPEIRIGLVGYRDKGDEYVLKPFDLNSDIDTVYANLQSFRAAGGGDGPESVNEALAEAVERMSWSPDRSVLKIVFLVGDAPPHMDYANAPTYPQVCAKAVKKDLIVNTVQCGAAPETTSVWQEIARLAEGSYAAVAQTGEMAAVATPMDKELAELNRKLGTTLVAYGAPARRVIARKQAAAEAAPASVTADRLAFNSRLSLSVQGEGELLDSLAAGKLTVDSLKREELPDDLKKLDGDQLKAELDKRQAQRAQIQTRILQLSKDRDAYIAAERKRQAGQGSSFDEKVAAFVQAQAARKGIVYQR